MGCCANLLLQATAHNVIQAAYTLLPAQKPLTHTGLLPQNEAWDGGGLNELILRALTIAHIVGAVVR